MNYTLIGSLTSPYVRKLRILLQTLGPYEFKAINYLEKKDNDYLNSINPIGKIPVFFDGETAIYDSRVIYNYLAKKHQLKPLSIKEENILSEIDAAMDSSINIFSIRRGGLSASESNTFIDRQNHRVNLILNEFSHWAETDELKNPANWNILTISLYSYLDWAQFRGMIDLSPYPSLRNFLECFSNAPGVNETKIPA